MRLAIADAGGIRIPDGVARPNGVVVARGLLRVRTFDLERVPQSKRPAALRLQCASWAPFAKAEFGARLIGGIAEVFAWDAEALRRALEASGLKLGSSRCYPEPVLRGPLPEGIRLVATVDGYEGQLGASGRLKESRWWAGLPDSTQWINFQRAAGVAADRQAMDVPAPVDLQLEAPWPDYGAVDDLAARLPLAEHLVYAALLLALGLPLAWYGVDAFRAHRDLAALNAALEIAERESAPALAAREAAMAADAGLRPLVTAFGGPSALSVLAAVSRSIPDDGTQVREFEYRDGDVRIVLAPSPSLAGSSLIQSLENSGAFREVGVTTGAGGLLTIVAHVDPTSARQAGTAGGPSTQTAGTSPNPPLVVPTAPAPTMAPAAVPAAPAPAMAPAALPPTSPQAIAPAPVPAASAPARAPASPQAIAPAPVPAPPAPAITPAR